MEPGFPLIDDAVWDTRVLTLSLSRLVKSEVARDTDSNFGDFGVLDSGAIFGSRGCFGVGVRVGGECGSS